MACGCNRSLSNDLHKCRILAQAMANETKVNQIIYEVKQGYNFCPINCWKYQPKVEEIFPEVSKKVSRVKQIVEVEDTKTTVENVQLD